MSAVEWSPRRNSMAVMFEFEHIVMEVWPTPTGMPFGYRWSWMAKSYPGGTSFRTAHGEEPTQEDAQVAAERWLSQTVDVHAEEVRDLRAQLLAIRKENNELHAKVEEVRATLREQVDKMGVIKDLWKRLTDGLSR